MDGGLRMINKTWTIEGIPYFQIEERWTWIVMGCPFFEIEETLDRLTKERIAENPEEFYWRKLRVTSE